jgi:hypothetical protein
MATDVWNINAGSAEGRDNFFRPIERADKIVEDQGLLPSKLAAAERKRIEEESYLNFYTNNPTALQDSIGQKFDYNTAFYDENTAALEEKTQQRSYRQSADKLISDANEVTTRERQFDENNDPVWVDSTRPATDTERLDIAKSRAPNYQVRQLLDAKLKLSQANDMNAAVAGGDYLTAYAQGQKAGIIEGSAKLSKSETGDYVLETTYGGKKVLSEQAVREMFFSQKTKEKLYEDRLNHQQKIQELAITQGTREYIAEGGKNWRGNRGQGGGVAQAPAAPAQTALTIKPEARQWVQSLPVEQNTAIDSLPSTPENKQLVQIAMTQGNTPQGIAARNALTEMVRKKANVPLQKAAQSNQVLPTDDPAYDAAVKERDLAKTNVSQIEADLRLMSGTLSGKNFTDEKRQKAAAALVQAKAAQEAAKLKVDSMQSGISPVFNRREVAAGRLSREY